MALPPGPSYSRAYQVFRWIRSPIEYMDECSRAFGDVFTLAFSGIGEVVILSSPEAIKDVFTWNHDDAHAGEANVVLRPFLGEHSLLLLDGPEHLRQRKMMMPAFHGERMAAYGRAMLDATDASIDGWPVGTPFPIHDPMQSITLSVIIRTVFGLAEGPRFAELADLLAKSHDAVAWPPLLFPIMQKDYGPWSPWGKFVRYSDRARAILLAEVNRARAEGTRGRSDVLAMLVGARDESGEPMSDEEILHELVTLLVAGHETTATALAWAFRWLGASPSITRRLRDEVATAMDGDVLVPERLAKLELLDCVVKETLRLQPVIPLVGRVLQRPKRVLGHDLPAGTAVAPLIYLVHRRPSLYPNPDSFDPERFRTFRPSASEWFPFGGGIRKCIGAAFAVYEMKMVLAAVLMRTSMRLAASRVRVVRRAITLTPSEGLPVVVTSKRRRRGAIAA